MHNDVAVSFTELYCSVFRVPFVTFFEVAVFQARNFLLREPENSDEPQTLLLTDFGLSRPFDTVKVGHISLRLNQAMVCKQQHVESFKSVGESRVKCN